MTEREQIVEAGGRDHTSQPREVKRRARGNLGGKGGVREVGERQNFVLYSGKSAETGDRC